MGVSRREYARLRGVSESAVRKAISTGRISVEPDGTIDPERADRQWDERTDPALQRGEHARGMAAATAAVMARAGAETGAAPRGTKAVPEAALAAVRETLDEAGEDPDPRVPAGEVSFMRARLANEVLKAQLQKIRLAREKGELVDRAKAQATVFDLARRERDAWIGWPARVAANIAAELGVDAHRTEQVLDRYLRDHLGELAEIRVDLGGGS
ncbi:elements of external origin [Tabrizicola thermarum]|uniref:elements of external origin n=1 Tax=Tabrizicola thermarum TaxID=2670345 RepID=UPI000FFB922C|nr:elements of external origin [Tabrizicola thermarum]